MIIDNEIFVNISNKTRSHFISKGYNVKNKKQIKVKTVDLPT